MSYEIGQRVRTEHGFAGTVRYVGPVATSKDASASWVGVEWDDVTRGKHDGMVTCKDGSSARYFTCAMGAGQLRQARQARRGHRAERRARVALRHARRAVARSEPRVDAGEPCVVNTRTAPARTRPRRSSSTARCRSARTSRSTGSRSRCARRASRAGAPGTLTRAAGHLEHLDLQANLLELARRRRDRARHPDARRHSTSRRTGCARSSARTSATRTRRCRHRMTDCRAHFSALYERRRRRASKASSQRCARSCSTDAPTSSVERDVVAHQLRAADRGALPRAEREPRRPRRMVSPEWAKSSRIPGVRRATASRGFACSTSRTARSARGRGRSRRSRGSEPCACCS